MTSSQGGSKDQQVNNCVKAEYQGDVNRFVSIEPGSQGVNESRTSRIDENVQGGGNQVAMDGNAPPQAPPHQLQGSLVHWEKFLHVRSIKVMLVEDDDCTRHIVTALLRNCNYEVIEAANGFQAWKILENLSNHIDIVLTEVVMPCLSGIGLLCKIMSHKTRKNIPVIMMSSHDSMGLVFKCLSKGAVDFLVKPIRKNELKNLWQHVWRRCHSSSGSGSESGTQAQKSVNSKNNLRYDNSGSKDRDDNGSSSDGSGTQSSWTKHAVEEIPSNPISEEHPDSTCGIVIFSDNNENGKAKEIAICGSKDTMENGKTEKIINPNANGIHDSNILRHSELSAFTRYKTKITASCPPPDNRSNTVKQEFKRDVHSDNNIVPPGNVVREELRIHHIHHHHHVHHYHNIDTTEQPLSNHDAPHCGSSNVMGGGGGPVEGNLEHYSLNRSGSGSKHGSNVNFEVTKVENDVDKSGNTINHDISAKRKAALTKFRQKRELRCFQKKVRYQNRKRLAEQRPRVRGQFVKGTSRVSSTNAADG